jgi:sulfatase maturation enzyme AslB (radical SAM superfamily)
LGAGASLPAPKLAVSADAAVPGSAFLSWAEESGIDSTLEIEEQSSGVLTVLKAPRSPIAVHELVPEGYYDARLRISGRQVGQLAHFSTMRASYFEDTNPRPKHILSMDEGNKFEHSRMIRVLNVSPGQVLPPRPHFQWLTRIEGVNGFDLALFNKSGSYWAFLRGIRNNNALPAHALEPGEWFLFVKASRDLGQIWSFPLHFVVAEGAAQEQPADPVIIRPKYMDSEGEYFTREIEERRGGNRERSHAASWFFRPEIVGEATLCPTIKWMPVPGAAAYDLHLTAAGGGAVSRSLAGLADNGARVEKPLATGSYHVVVHALIRDQASEVVRRIRSAKLELEIVDKPFAASYRAMEKTLLRKLEREKAFAEHMDAIAGMDAATNLKLKRWEVENGVANLLSMPTNLTTLVGYNCNIDCHFCDNGRVPRDIVIPPKFIEDLKFFMPYARAMQVLGGEPLMLKEFRRIVDLAKDHPHLMLATTTNGTLVDDEWAHFFARSNFTQIWMSVDGATEPVYQSMRRGGELRKVVDGVKKITAYGTEAPTVGWSFIVSRRNYQEIVDYYRLARDLGVKSIFYKMLQLRFGPNYPGVGRLDALMDREICAKVMEDLAIVRDMARDDGIHFDERVVSYVRHVHPDLARQFLDAGSGVSRAAVEGSDEVFGRGTGKTLPAPVKGDPKEQQRLLERLIRLHQDLGNNRFKGVPLKQQDGDEFCELPFTHLGLNGTNAYMCCYASPQVLPISFEPDQEHLTDVWNSQRYQFSREAFFNRRVDDACLPTCPYRKQEGVLWEAHTLQ